MQLVRFSRCLVLLIVCFLSAVAQAQAAGQDADLLVVRRLIESLKDPDPDVRIYLSTALVKMGTVAIEPLIAALQDGVPERRAGAAYTLGLIGLPARAALPQLLTSLDDKDQDVRRQVAFAISRIVPDKRPAPGKLAGAPSE